MKLLAPFITFLLLFSIHTPLLSQTFSDSRSVRGYATADEEAKAITLQWNTTANTTAYKIYRRLLASDEWGIAVASLTSEVTSYTDTDIEAGVVYEYAIERFTNTNDRFASGNILGYSYIATGIKIAPMHSRGSLWLLTTKLIQDSLPNEVATLVNDLVADGWSVYNEVINPTATVSDIKDFIKNKHTTTGCDAVYLLGHVPVPYSGIYCEDDVYTSPPDGHDQTDPNSHCGAWPADPFYGDMEGTWTDNDSTSLAKRPENDNAIGDGKYDQHRIPGAVTVAVGRVDMSNLPLFGVGEVALTKRYLDKVHQYKIGNTPLIQKGVIENNFIGLDEGFSSAAIRDFYAIAGDNGIVEQDLLEAAKEEDYMLSYVCGAGSYTSCGGFGTSDSFLTNNGAAFNHLFGSFFGDWDIENNLMRASLATEHLGFNAIWSGRPKWATHTLAIGESYGDIAIRSQNNFLNYDGNFFQNGAHMALLGDPSLRIHAIQPPNNISLAASDGRNLTIVSWDASEEPDVLGYFVYRSTTNTGKFEPVNNSPIEATTFIDPAPFEGTNHYMVRTAKKQVTGSGSYINLSLGISAEINEMKGRVASLAEVQQSTIKVYPTIAATELTIEQELPKETSYLMYNTTGHLVAQGNFATKQTTADVSHLASGAYFIKTAGGTARFIKR